MFTKTELDNLEFAVNQQIKDMDCIIRNCANWETVQRECAIDQKENFEKLLEKVRKM